MSEASKYNIIKHIPNNEYQWSMMVNYKILQFNYSFRDEAKSFKSRAACVIDFHKP